MLARLPSAALLAACAAFAGTAAYAQAGPSSAWDPQPLADPLPAARPHDPLPRLSLAPRLSYATPLAHSQQSLGLALITGWRTALLGDRLEVDAEVTASQGSSVGAAVLGGFGVKPFTLSRRHLRLGGTALLRVDDAPFRRAALLLGAGGSIVLSSDRLDALAANGRELQPGLHALLGLEVANTGPGSLWFEGRLEADRAGPVSTTVRWGAALSACAGYRFWFR